MNVISYCKKLHKRLIIKTALSHLLLGVIAAGFGLYEENALPVQSSSTQVGIIAITAIVQDHQAPIRKKSQTSSLLKEEHYNKQIISLNYDEVTPNTVIRLSPYNGIRAGPQATA
ncbi:hypothetical protein J3U22_04315 [Gilliamella sp. B2865]|uniref:hypothetical protein n=1 Tax=unclassified Gilliamella TaxID=2685620 RepID=UPI00226A17CC|nr:MULTISPECIES: hypothetical protein [unclassified Gilliamella]MCX8670596.1 hypothetical protein [Gilliamella sp. B2785]MCX8678825.1 hypothetical protein [Gilliamella sp. B2865]